MTGTVLVSGGSGYIAGYIIRQLVEDGWTVHTTIRNLAKESAVRALLAVDNSKLSFFAADLNSDAGWNEAMTGCSHVVHVASPLPNDKPKTDDELIIPARDGALRPRFGRSGGVSDASISRSQDPMVMVGPSGRRSHQCPNRENTVGSRSARRSRS